LHAWDGPLGLGLDDWGSTFVPQPRLKAARCSRFGSTWISRPANAGRGQVRSADSVAQAVLERRLAGNLHRLRGCDTVRPKRPGLRARSPDHADQPELRAGHW
jgi:hypothetical protein